MVELIPVSWDDVLRVGVPLFLILGILVIRAILLNPRLFWPMLIVVNILGNGPKVVSYIILDEILTGFIVIGALIRLGKTKAHGNPGKSAAFEGRRYLLWIGYLFFQSCVGLIVNDDLRLMRFVLFYLLLGLLWFIVRFRGHEFPFPSDREVSVLVTVTTIVYYVAYLGQGIYFQSVLGEYGQFLSQEYYWSGSAVAVFPTLLAIPAAVFLVNDRSGKLRALAWASIALTMTVAFYFDSRVSWFVIFGLCAISWRKLHLSRILGFSILFLVLAYLLLGNAMSARLPSLFDELLGSSQALWLPRESDAKSRNLQLVAGVETMVGDWRILIFGAGFYSHRYLMVPYVREGMARFPNYGDFVSLISTNTGQVEILRTTGLPALLVDTGMVGMVLLASNVMLVARNVSRTRTPRRLILLTVLVSVVFWLLVANILDMIMWYMLLMPRGLLTQWNRASSIESQAKVDDGERFPL